MFEGQEQQQPCVICHQSHQQMLMLSCVHDPCINCAAQHYVENQPHNSPIYTCPKCGQETELDKSSVSELQRIYNNNVKGKKKSKAPVTPTYKDAYDERQPVKSRNQPLAYSRDRNYQQSQNTRYNPTVSSVPVSQPSYQGGKKVYQPTYPCNDHPDEDLTYYCFSCNRPICPQCAIHGLHREHEVQTTRKAIKQIKQVLIQDRQKLDQEMGETASTREQAKRLTKQWSDQNKHDQQFIRKKLAQLKQAIAQKQKELTRSCDNNLERNCEILRGESTASEKSLDVIASVKRNIENTLKKEDLAVLQEFNKRDEETTDALLQAEKDREKIRDQQVKNPLRCVDTTVLDEEVDRIIGDLQAIKLSSTIPK